ncbi:hypothetical protein D9619_011057 [Psilocybe cf. subviscida]|uniref:Uncharacterized protein n=1 Tax=Psilocybe cf. subviscida TaxID=2480587 RepID=A0A8H5EZN5_9AGAR|nr:hypothetical protein D9619_011057 [Psilocybe cf. subviscida]
MFALSESTLGVPLSVPAVTPVAPLNCDLPQCAVAAPGADIHHQRSRYAIIQTCLATLFICIWQSSHPDLGGPRDSGLRRTCLKRIQAGKIADLYNAKFVGNVPKKSWWQPTCESIKEWFHPRPVDATKYDYVEPWTTSHGFFIQMGGFILYEDNLPKQILDYDRFSDLLLSKSIDLPRISTRDLDDRSKGDTISKSIAIFQTCWFILQCLVRLGQHLPLSELEVFTLASAALNGAIYAAFWSKPQGVEVAICLPLKDGHSVELQTSDQYGEDSMAQRPTTQDSPVISQILSLPEHTGDLNAERQHSIANAIPMGSNDGPNSSQGADRVVNPDDGTGATDPPNQLAGPQSVIIDSDRNYIQFKQELLRLFNQLIRAIPLPAHTGEPNTEPQRGPRGTIPMQSIGGPNSSQGADGVVDPDDSAGATNPLKVLLATLLSLLKHDARRPNLITSIITKELKQLFTQLIRTNSLRVDSSSASGNALIWVLPMVCVVGSLFGAIHFFAWGLEFPTKKDRITWHICAIGLTCIPILLLEETFSNRKGLARGDHNDSEFADFLLFALAGCPAVLAFMRIAVAVVSLRAIANPPPAVLLDITWTSLIPHI